MLQFLQCWSLEALIIHLLCWVRKGFPLDSRDIHSLPSHVYSSQVLLFNKSTQIKWLDTTFIYVAHKSVVWAELCTHMAHAGVAQSEGWLQSRGLESGKLIYSHLCSLLLVTGWDLSGDCPLQQLHMAFLGDWCSHWGLGSKRRGGKCILSL